MNKVIFVLHRREGVTHDEFLGEWSSDRHVSLVRALPGLTLVAANVAGNTTKR